MGKDSFETSSNVKSCAPRAVLVERPSPHRFPADPYEECQLSAGSSLKHFINLDLVQVSLGSSVLNAVCIYREHHSILIVNSTEAFGLMMIFNKTIGYCIDYKPANRYQAGFHNIIA